MIHYDTLLYIIIILHYYTLLYIPKKNRTVNLPYVNGDLLFYLFGHSPVAVLATATSLLPRTDASRASEEKLCT
jgi:hypothetical protein